MKINMRLFGTLVIAAIAVSFAFTTPHEKKIVVIDAGHGGQDTGIQSGTFSESKITNEIALKIKKLNQNPNLEIVLLRENDQFIDLNKRREKANEIKPNLMISLHVNGAINKDTNGIDAYVTKKSEFYEQSTAKANQFLNQLSNENLTKGKVKEASFLILRNISCPAILLELGFLSNEKDKNYITSEKGQTEIANNILKVLSE